MVKEEQETAQELENFKLAYDIYQDQNATVKIETKIITDAAT